MLFALPRPFIVGNALRLGRAGIFRGQDQHDQGEDIGQHVVHVAGQVQPLQEIKARVYIAQRAEEAKQQRRQGDADGLPLAEDHHRQRQGPKAGHGVVKIPCARARWNVHQAANAERKLIAVKPSSWE